MEGEINNFIVVWIAILASLFYCYTIGNFTTKRTTRFFAILPIMCLFFYLPLNLTTIYLGSTTAFFIAWLANFKLLLFTLGKGQLSSYPPLHLPHFILISCLPIKIQHKETKDHLETTQTRHNKSHLLFFCLEHKSHLLTFGKVVLLAILIRVYSYKDYIHPKIIMMLYCVHFYIIIEMLLVLVAVMARAAFRLELEPPFDEPYLASSLQNFWGKRWNIVVSAILRTIVYNPVRVISNRLIGKKWGPIPAILATFFVSALMHELIFYYAGRVMPTWEVTCFFIIQGICVAIEFSIKRALNRKFKPHPLVSGPLVVGFVVVTAIWLFIPPILQCEADVRASKETIAFVEFIKNFGNVFKI